MDIDNDKIDDTVLALLYLTLHDNSRAWKGYDWQVMNRLYENDMIETLLERRNQWLSPLRARESPSASSRRGRHISVSKPCASIGRAH